MSRTSSTDGERRWIGLCLQVSASRIDEQAGAFGPDVLGIETRASDPGGDGLHLLAYFPDHDAARDDIARLRAGGVPFEIVEVEDGRWVERYQAGLRPLPLGERFVVVPGTETPGGTDRTVIRLVPGRAFGTGEHATTRLCAAWLETRVARGQRWLDLGTGSGVLAVVAATLGARVLAVDVDPEAVAVAREVAQNNGVGGTVSVREASVEAWNGPPADGVVANISERFFLTNAPAIAAVLRSGGCLVASGFLAEDEDAVVTAISEAGLMVVDRSAEGEWRSAVAVRT